MPSGTLSPQTIHVTKGLKKQVVTILIDLESTHNFIHPSLAKQLACRWSKENSLKVKIANGDKMTIEGICDNLSLDMQEYHFTVDFFMFSLGSCNVILGASWLHMLGPIVWDFSKVFT